MTYAQFHLVFLLPALLVAALGARPALAADWRPPTVGIALLCLMALVYTTPWDAYLVREGIWWYGNDRVLGTFLGVPYEEYVFFVLQTVLTGLVTIAALARGGLGADVKSGTGSGRARTAGAAAWLLAAAGGAALLSVEATRYLGLIVAWAFPILAVIWLAVGDRLWALRRPLATVVLGVTLYLCVADRIAIELGIWTISETYTTGVTLLGLPLEEALFFLVTNLMVSLGLTGVLLAVHRSGGRPAPAAWPARRVDASVG